MMHKFQKMLKRGLLPISLFLDHSCKVEGPFFLPSNLQSMGEKILGNKKRHKKFWGKKKEEQI